MSKYTDFYASTGGEIVAINGYVDFLVGATGNPTGYDNTTGIYDHPGGATFIRTGFTTAAGPYPDANATGGNVGDATAAVNLDSLQPLFIRIK